MGKSRPVSLQTVELKVRMCCTGCERIVKDSLMRLRDHDVNVGKVGLSTFVMGVDSVEVDLPLERVVVTGYIDRNKVLKAIRKSGKKAEFWPNPGLPLLFTTPANYFQDENAYRESYNYWRHGYNGDRHGQIHSVYLPDDKVGTIFNDDNVHACSIM